MSEVFLVQELLAVYSIGFLGYVLNEDAERVQDRLVGDGDLLQPPKEEVLAALVVMENRFLELEQSHRSIERNAWLGEHRENLGRTVVAYFRNVCGGTESMPKVNDEVERLLLHFAEVTYPLRLQADKDAGAIPFSVRVPWHDPMRDQLQNAVLADAVLSKLYPNESEHSGPSGSALRSTGHGGGVQLWMFIENITTAAWHYAHFNNAQPNFDEYAQAVLHTVRTLKRALQGKTAEVPMRVGLAGVLLPEGIDSVDLGWAVVRRADQRDEHFTRRISVDGQLHHTNADGENILIDYAGNLVLELIVPYKVILKELDITDAWPEELMQTNFINESIECLRLAILLAGIGDKTTAASTWQSVVDPLYSAESIRWSDPRLGTNLLPVRLTNDQVDSWREWAVRIHAHRTPQTNVSIRRILRAVSEQKEPEDTLIDAVIVWENLFGAGQETALRITMSVAWLLGADGAARKGLFDELRKVYQQRSDIVHGNAKLKHRQTQPYAMRAIDVSIELLRVIFRDCPELLNLKTGVDRSAMTLLDARDIKD